MAFDEYSYRVAIGENKALRAKLSSVEERAREKACAHSDMAEMYRQVKEKLTEVGMDERLAERFISEVVKEATQ